MGHNIQPGKRNERVRLSERENVRNAATRQGGERLSVAIVVRCCSVYVAVPGEEVVEDTQRRLEIAVHNVWKREEGGVSMSRGSVLRRPA